jgi:hypothetical protein
VAGINLGVQQDSWTSSENPQEGLRIFISNPIISGIIVQLQSGETIVVPVSFSEEITLLSVIPDDLTD